MTPETKRLYLKIRNYCARAERCEQEVSDKLKLWGMSRQDIDTCLQLLITDGFIDNRRYARFFTSDKFKLQQWGRLKIAHHLKAKNIARPFIEAALQSEINEQDYAQTLHELAVKKNALLDGVDVPLLRKQKLINYLVQRGFEIALAQKTANDLVS